MKTCARASVSLGGFFDVPAKREQLERIEARASAPDFWNDQEAAQKLMSERSRLERAVARQSEFESSIEDAGVLLEFVEEDEASLAELGALLERLEKDVSQAETEMMLG